VARPCASPRWTAGVERRVLPNGLTVLVQADPGAPAAAIVTHVRAGFFDEPDRWQGISHVLEHMFFKGTPTRTVGRIATETKALGGYLNASTGYDATSYYVVLPTEGFEAALEIQADALRHASLDADELRRELRVIIEEAKRKLDSPAAVAGETLHAELFDRHRIRRWRIGTEAMLAGFTRDDVAGYYRSRYVPERVILAIVGAVAPEPAFAAAERCYGDWAPRPGAVDPSPEEPERREVRARTLRGDVKQAELAIGWRGVPPLHPDAPALALAAMVLGSGRCSRLYQALRLPSIVTSIAAHHYAPTEVGVFSIAADLDPASLGPALEGVAAEVRDLRDRGPDGQLERAQTLLTAQWARRLESAEGRASAFAAAEALGGVDLIEREYRALLAVTAGDVRRAVDRYLGADAVAAVAYLPAGHPGDLDRELLAEAFRRGRPASRLDGGGAFPVVAAGGPRSAPAQVVAGVEHVALPSADLLVRRKPGVPLVTLGVYRLRRQVETRETAGLGALAVRAAARGAGPWDAGQLADRFESLGGALVTSVAHDWFGFSTSVLSEHVGTAAALLRAVLEDPRFVAGEVERERDTLADEAAQNADDMFRRPIELALAAAFGDERYGLPVKGSPESVAGLTADQVVTWHRGERAGSRTTVVAVGDLDLDRACATLEAVFGRPDGTAPVGGPYEPPCRLSAGSRIEPRTKTQTALAMAFPGPARTDPDRHAADVLATVASGLGGRLFQALRDRRSLAYAVLMSSWQRCRAGALLTYIATSPDREAEAREAMLLELGRLAADRVTEEELDQAVSYLVGQAAVQRQTSSALASEILDAWLVGSGLEEIEDPAAPIRAVTREAVRDVAARSLLPEARAEGVVRGAS
jgi:zinc protease